MENNRAFAIYACCLGAAVASLITASYLAGIATVPEPLMFIEHLALSLGFRAAYKSLGGPAWWPYPSARPEANAIPHGADAPLPLPESSGDDEYQDAA